MMRNVHRTTRAGLAVSIILLLVGLIAAPAIATASDTVAQQPTATRPPLPSPRPPWYTTLTPSGWLTRTPTETPPWGTGSPYPTPRWLPDSGDSHRGAGTGWVGLAAGAILGGLLICFARRGRTSLIHRRNKGAATGHNDR